MTNDLKTVKALRVLFLQQLVPLADRIKSSGVEFLASSLDPKAETYYVTREKRTMSRADFEWGGCSSVDAFPAQLAELWRTQGHEELATLAPVLGKLAAALQTEETQDEDVSPFIYVMY
jgi:hypothetical protein